MTSAPRSLVFRMDESPAVTTQRVERVSQRILGVRARTKVLSEHIAELSRQFLDDEFTETSGPDQGQPLTREGRVAWLSRLAGLHRSYCSACDEEAQLQALLRRLEDSGAQRPAPGAESLPGAGPTREHSAST